MSPRSPFAPEALPLRRPADIRREQGQGTGSPPKALSWPPGFAATAEDRSALLVLTGLASLTARRLLETAARHGSAAACLAAVRDGAAGSEGDRRSAAGATAEGVVEAMHAAGARFVAVGDPDYPPELTDLFDPPAGLFVVGGTLSELRPRVAVVGARACSAGGGEMAQALGGALAAAGACVVSGGARGIDAAAHRGAVRAGGSSIAVMGSGVDVPYPAQNRQLLAEVAAAGAVISEYPPGTRAEPFRFPARNRLVAALGTAVVVVEGADGSGSMITAEQALEIGRDVLAVPGAVTNPLAAVPLQLIRDGATLVRGPLDVLEDVGLKLPEGRATGDDRAAGVSGLSVHERTVFEAIREPVLSDSVGRATGLSPSTVAAAMVALEIRGLIRQAGGRYERRLPRG